MSTFCAFQTVNPETKQAVEIIDAAELARRLGVPTSWIYEHCRDRAENRIPCLELGRYRRFAWNSQELNNWLESCLYKPRQVVR